MWSGDVEACRALLNAGADPNAEQQKGFRPLDEALLTKNEPLASLLQLIGARKGASPSRPLTPAMPISSP